MQLQNTYSFLYKKYRMINLKEREMKIKRKKQIKKGRENEKVMVYKEIV